MSENNLPTIFNAGLEERQTAIANLLKGSTPISEVKKRTVRGGVEANYVSTYYMTRQLSLITGFRWTSEYLQDKARPNWDNPVEIGVQVKVTIWDTEGNAYSHTCWGGKDVAHYSKDDTKGNYKAGDIISLFDDIKAAESDAIKKCISYFGVANDIYAHKELNYFEGDMTEDDAYKAFGKWLEEKHVLISKACEILKVEKLSDIKDFKSAKEEVEKAISSS